MGSLLVKIGWKGFFAKVKDLTSSLITRLRSKAPSRTGIRQRVANTVKVEADQSQQDASMHQGDCEKKEADHQGQGQTGDQGGRDPTDLTHSDKIVEVPGMRNDKSSTQTQQAQTP